MSRMVGRRVMGEYLSRCGRFAVSQTRDRSMPDFGVWYLDPVSISGEQMFAKHNMSVATFDTRRDALDALDVLLDAERRNVPSDVEPIKVVRHGRGGYVVPGTSVVFSRGRHRQWSVTFAAHEPLPRSVSDRLFETLRDARLHVACVWPADRPIG